MIEPQNVLTTGILSCTSPSWASLADVLRVRAAETPDKSVFKFMAANASDSEVMTYRDLDREATGIACELRRAGDLSQHPALLAYPLGLAFIAAFFGCLYAGVVPVPVALPSNRSSAEKLRTIAGHSGARSVLTTSIHLRRVRSVIADSLPGGHVHWIATDEIAAGQVGATAFPKPTPDTLAFVQYSSGSTGTPKGVMVSHGNLVHNLSLLAQHFEICSSDIGVSWLPHYHDMGLVAGLLLTIHMGTTTVLMDPLTFLVRPVSWLAAISAHRATYSGGPNFGYEHCVTAIEEQDTRGLDLSSWSLATIAAEPVRAGTMDRFVQAFARCGFRREAFYPGYGLAEATLMVSGGSRRAAPIVQWVQASGIEGNGLVNPADEERPGARPIVSCGRPRLDVAIVRPETLVACRDGEIGEIWVRGDSVAQGYWGRPEESARTFHAHIPDTDKGPFLRTGDLGFIRDNELYVTGRLKDLLIIRGRNHYPQDIELTVQQSHRALRPDCGAAFSIESGDQERVVVVQEVDQAHAASLNREELVRAVRSAVWAKHELQIHALTLVRPGSIPKTSSGKICRSICKAGFLSGQLNSVAEWSGATA
jgi:acyl-CoA synthetase (AMP-forming)/AMP-acid ligase II